MTTLQGLSAPVGWKDSPPDYRGDEWRSWETTAPLRAIVAGWPMKCESRVMRPLIGCLVPVVGDERWCHGSCPPWHQDQEWCETNGQVSRFSAAPGHCAYGFAFCDTPNQGKIEEFMQDDRIQWQAICFVGGCTDCGCVDVGVGIIHHPSCGWDLLGDFDSVPLALQALEEAGYALGSMLTLGQKTLWSRAEKADSF